MEYRAGYRCAKPLGLFRVRIDSPDDDIEGYVELCRTLDVPIANGEVRVRGLRDYAELVRHGAVDIVRCAADVQHLQYSAGLPRGTS